jgi:2-polyprenyl-6-methoxyphenol hydroxylase-like FAD-dependent oxidoreductase
VQDAHGVTATFTETRGGAKREIGAPWLVGCDGGGSGVRCTDQIG